MKTLNLIFVALVTLFAANSCAPVFSNLQSAKLVGKGNVEAAPHFTSTSHYSETEHIQDHVGLQLGYGLSNRFDIIARYENISGPSNGNANVFGIGPKMSIIKDRMAAYLPVGFAFGGDIDGMDQFQTQPSLIFTFPVGRYVEINPSTKAIISNDVYYAANLGLGLSTNFQKYVIRPEYGLLIIPGESGSYGQFSIGASFYFAKLFSKKK